MFKEGMNWSDNNEMKTQEELTALVIGHAFLNQMKSYGVMQDILAAVDSQAMRILEEIVQTLDDETLDDPECFQKIQKILTVLESNWLGSTRHDL